MKMPKKHQRFPTVLLAILLGALSQLQAGEDHPHPHPAGHTHNGHSQGSHDHHEHTHETKTPGPNGGRIIHQSAFHFEFFVEADRKVRITLLDETLQPVQASNQIVNGVAGDRRNPKQLAFAIKDGVFRSNQPLPEGERVPIILTLRETPESEIVRQRLMVNLSDCPSCDYLEYACICAH